MGMVRVALNTAAAAWGARHHDHIGSQFDQLGGGGAEVFDPTLDPSIRKIDIPSISPA
jgi:hypothetical protein